LTGSQADGLVRKPSGHPTEGVDVNAENELTSDALAPSVQPRSTGSQRIELRGELAKTELASFEATDDLGSPKRILVLKLDHLGDFLIGIPALKQLREVFQSSQITLICGPWNVTTAQKLCAADDVKAFDYFPENAQDWDGAIADGAVGRFREVTQGHFDIAIDLRVDEDTRPLLRHVDATLRCGIGSRQKHPYLDVVLPPEFERRETGLSGNEELIIGPNGFHSRMTTQTPFYHETDFSTTNGHLVYGPYCQLPLGKLRAELAYQLTAPRCWSPRVGMIVDVVRHDRQESVAVLDLPRLPKSDLFRVDVRFSNDDPYARYEIRTSVRGKPRWTRLRFFGAKLEVEGVPHARFRSAELHIGESLSLLVRLVAERVRPLYALDLADRLAARSVAASPRPTALPTGAKCIVIAPLSNSLLRNWPIDRYERLITMLMTKIDSRILLAGSPGQTRILTDLHRRLGDDRRIVNIAGRADWGALAASIKEADLVIANNSGVAHLAAACGTPTLAIYSGSHQPQEWGPRGRSVRTLMAAVPCSPCGHDKLEACPHDHLCMTLIEPENVLRHAIEMLNRAAPSSTLKAEKSLAS
jgi:ADP-heptose:LPS heptosyltransferase